MELNLLFALELNQLFTSEHYPLIFGRLSSKVLLSVKLDPEEFVYHSEGPGAITLFIQEFPKLLRVSFSSCDSGAESALIFFVWSSISSSPENLLPMSWSLLELDSEVFKCCFLARSAHFTNWCWVPHKPWSSISSSPWSWINSSLQSSIRSSSGDYLPKSCSVLNSIQEN